MWLDPKYYPVRIAVLVTVAVMLFLFVQTTHAADKTFPMGKEINANIALCLEEGFAKTLADQDDQTPILLMTGRCAVLAVPIKFVRFVYKNGEISVYEADVRGVKVYAVTNWKAESL